MNIQDVLNNLELLEQSNLRVFRVYLVYHTNKFHENINFDYYTIRKIGSSYDKVGVCTYPDRIEFSGKRINEVNDVAKYILIYNPHLIFDHCRVECKMRITHCDLLKSSQNLSDVCKKLYHNSAEICIVYNYVIISGEIHDIAGAYNLIINHIVIDESKYIKKIEQKDPSEVTNMIIEI
ncbi:MAG: hypothetical protein Terrestrivirus4_110 [Terrestrivirus sp.]|uniref:Uncharacterized protein n=1 Tax=Terrestrivirus sp. TaxID=2487775 RepID=A0A3G4ZMH8_9VIRU|nr:MAG: hypothetical protein Terrestrivirus4_110 [Terrestrivirus sp.]